jgi:hypothetical protein
VVAFFFFCAVSVLLFICSSLFLFLFPLIIPSRFPFLSFCWYDYFFLLL